MTITEQKILKSEREELDSLKAEVRSIKEESDDETVLKLAEMVEQMIDVVIANLYSH